MIIEKGKSEMRVLLKRSAAILMALAMILALMPAITGQQVHAGDGMSVKIHVENSDGTVYSGDVIYVSLQELNDELGSDYSTLFDEGKVEAYWGHYGIDDGYREKAIKKGNNLCYTVMPGDFDKEIAFYTRYYDTNYGTSGVYVGTYINIKTDASGIATVTGETTTSKTFTGVRIDSSITLSEDTSAGKKKFEFTFDTKKYDIGFHSIQANLSDGSICKYPFASAFVSKIYAKPALKANWFETWKDCFVMTSGNYDSAKYGDIYIDYRKKGGSWQTQYGPWGPNSQGKIAKLSPNTTYEVRAYYAKKMDSGYYLLGQPSSTVTIKTGPKSAPAIKSVKISKAKVKKVWVKPILDAFGFVVKKGFWTYETTYKVTIKFKKKPGVAGIEVYAGGVTLPKYIKGNKKTYTTTFTVGGKAKGKKTTFKICTKGNAAYGAWSPYATKKKVKIKK